MGRDRWTTRLCVEDCPIHLDVEILHRTGAFQSQSGSTWTISWTHEHGTKLGELEYTVQSTSTGLAIVIRQQYKRLDSVLRFVQKSEIPIAASRPHLGGQRLWFECQCDRRVRRLYLPPGQQMFACRHCHNLTYESAQTHDKRKCALLRDPAMLRAALGSKNIGRFGLGIGALAAHMRRMRKREGQSV
jgi:hypothetical protein